jgi:hypothetical protein
LLQIGKIEEQVWKKSRSLFYFKKYLLRTLISQLPKQECRMEKTKLPGQLVVSGKDRNVGTSLSLTYAQCHGDLERRTCKNPLSLYRKVRGNEAGREKSVSGES